MASDNRTAGLFDIRTIIGSLLGFYGVVLTLMGAFGDTPHVQSDLVAVVDCVDDVPEDTRRLVPGDPMPLKGSLVDT